MFVFSDIDAVRLQKLADLDGRQIPIIIGIHNFPDSVGRARDMRHPVRKNSRPLGVDGFKRIAAHFTQPWNGTAQPINSGFEQSTHRLDFFALANPYYQPFNTGSKASRYFLSFASMSVSTARIIPAPVRYTIRNFAGVARADRRIRLFLRGERQAVFIACNRLFLDGIAAVCRKAGHVFL